MIVNLDVVDFEYDTFKILYRLKTFLLDCHKNLIYQISMSRVDTVPFFRVHDSEEGIDKVSVVSCMTTTLPLLLGGTGLRPKAHR